MSIKSGHEKVEDRIRNQIDYVLVDKRFRNGIQNSKSMPGADCQSDHNPVVITVKIRLQRDRKARRAAKWNISNLKRPEVRTAFTRKLVKQLQDGKVAEEVDVDRIWSKLKENLEIVAEEICGKHQRQKKQNWMSVDLLCKMEERRITPIIERQLGESQMGFRKRKGTRDAIFQLRMISERITQMREGRRNRWKKIISMLF
jgi:hypothetical protein